MCARRSGKRKSIPRPLDLGAKVGSQPKIELKFGWRVTVDLTIRP